MMKSIVSISVVAAALVAGVSPAAAAVKTATYSGTLQSGNDLTGVFGAANTNLAGASYIATFTYDRNLGGSQSTVPGVSDSSAGGSFYGTASPMISASITINSITRSFSAGFDDLALTSANPFPQAWHVAQRKVLGADFVTAKYNPLTSAGSLDDDVAPNAATGTGSFQIYAFDSLTAATTEFATGIFANDAIYSVGDAVVVPEPASWAMLIAGFGLTGTAMRRRRQHAVGA
jgi:hypothetical protein